MNLRRIVVFVTVLVVPTLGVAQPLNVMFYGNSFTLGFGSTRSVNALFEDIAIAAGQEAPLVLSAAASGQDLEWHVNNNTAPIFTQLPPSRDWDAIVLQEHSTKLTRAYTGSPAFPASVDESKQTAIDLYNVAKNRSAGVVPVLYQTWARGPGHEFYDGASPQFTGPSEMQAEIRSGYESLQAALDDAIGDDVTRIARVGDAWEVAEYDNLHANDLWHAQNRGTLLAALVIYGTVYGDTTTSDIDLSGVLASVNLSDADGVFLTAAADSVLGAIPEPGAAPLLVVGVATVASRPRRRRSV